MMIVAPAAKPEPVIVTVVPSLPLVGDTEIDAEFHSIVANGMFSENMVVQPLPSTLLHKVPWKSMKTDVSGIDLLTNCEFWGGFASNWVT